MLDPMQKAEHSTIKIGGENTKKKKKYRDWGEGFKEQNPAGGEFTQKTGSKPNLKWGPLDKKKGSKAKNPKTLRGQGWRKL